VVLAAAVLAIAPAATVAAVVRRRHESHTSSALAAAIRARGADEARVALHGVAAAASALAPLLTTVGAYALGASVVVERAFGLDGLGRVALDAAARGDTPVLVGVAVVAGVILATLSVCADLIARRIDPR
jgi:peptide/nickel transport system permease protein